MKRSTVIETIVFLYAILFLYTGLNKLMEHSYFKMQLADSPILAPVAPLIASFLPLLEFLIVLMLVLPRWRLKGFYTALTLIIIYTLYIVAVMTFRDMFPCNCGGILANLSWPQHIILNIFYIAMAIGSIALQKGQRKQIQIPLLT